MALAQAALVSAHMEMSDPPPLRSKHNPFAGQDIDYSMTSPLSASGSDFPCKGSLSLLGTDAASPVASWEAGQSYSLSIEGGANHNGGSCQASLSYDGGETFNVIHSYVGGCPPAGTSSYDFTIPDDAPSADDAIFAWTWFNNVGNREMYMNCAIVSIEGSSTSTSSFSSRPEILVANVGNGCSTTEGSDVEFPNPGPSVSSEGSGTAPPSGSCGGGGSDGGNDSGNDGGNDNGDGSNPGIPDSGEPNPGVPPQQPPTPIQPEPVPEPEEPAPEQPAPTTSTLPGGIFIPVPSDGPVSEPATTLSTITTPVSTPLVPQPTSTPGEEDGNGGVEGAQNPGTPCDSEGLWNCVGGNHFQRCASGAWSQLMAMAAGTSCETGVSEALVTIKKRGGARRILSI